MGVKELARSAILTLSKHSPEILTGLGVVGFATTIVMTAKAAPKAADIHKWEETYRHDTARNEDEVKESYLEEAKSLAPLVVPPAIVGIASVSCFIFSNKVSADRRAAIMAAYSLSTETLARYQEKVTRGSPLRRSPPRRQSSACSTLAARIRRSCSTRTGGACHLRTPGTTGRFPSSCATRSTISAS